MSRPSPLTQADQEKLIQQIGVALLRVVPVEWQRILIEYRAAGKHIEMSAEVLATDGTTLNWAAPRDCAQLFGRLRSGMFEEDRGTWLRSRYLIKQPSSYAIGFDYEEEPRWQNPPPPIAFVDELRFFPRPEDKIPAWMSERIQAAVPPQGPPTPPPGTHIPAFRTARVFDGVSADGTPTAEREPVSATDRPRLVEYLRQAPVIFSSRGMDTDKLSADQAPVVPMTFHTDGTWVWSAAVWFYLSQHNVPPEQALLEHIRERGFTVPQVDEPTRRAAAATLVPPPQPPRPAPGPSTGGHAVMTVDGERLERNGTTNGHPAPIGTPLPERQEDPRRELDNAALDVLRHRLAELQVPPGSFRINEVDDRSWCLIRVPDGGVNTWSVFWSESGERHNEVTFGKVAEASAYLLGALLLAPIPQES